MGSGNRNTVVLAFGLAFLLFLGYVLRRSIALIYVSIIFATIFSPIVGRLSRIKIRGWSPSRGTSILLLLAAVLLALGVFFALALPPIVNDAHGLSNDLPTRLNQLTGKISQLPMGDKIASKLNVGSLEKYLGDIFQSVFKVFQGIAGGITALITMVIMTAYFILDGERVFQWSVSLVRAKHQQKLRLTLLDAARRAQRWLGGQLLLMLILGGASAVTFGLLHLRYFYAIAVFAGVANFVPILGPIATVVVAALVAALDSWTKVLGVVIFYAVYQQVENSYLTPRIMESTVDLPPVAVIVALLIGGELAGLLGAIVAVPTAAIIATVLREYAIRPHEAAVNTPEWRKTA
jgi:predicted PurR-regulated permease PerM